MAIGPQVRFAVGSALGFGHDVIDVGGGTATAHAAGVGGQVDPRQAQARRLSDLQTQRRISVTKSALGDTGSSGFGAGRSGMGWQTPLPLAMNPLTVT